MLRHQRIPDQHRPRSRQDSGNQENIRPASQSGPETAGNYPNSLIADMAKGFVEAQAKINNSPAENTNREMLQLLQKISLQLDTIQQPAAGGSSALRNGANSASSSGGNTPAGAAQQQKTQSPPELQTLFGQLLAVANQGQTAAPIQGQSQSKSSGQNFSANRPQEAAQALAQAQYELSRELEASLAKLKQVIAESEKLAEKISGIIDSDSNSQ